MTREILAQAARAADIVVNAASADHKGAVVALLDALAGSGKPFIHTSGSSIVGTRAKGERSDAIFDEDTPITPSPARAARVALNEFILSYRDKGCRPVIICPSLIYGTGLGANPDSVQVPLLIKLAKKRGNAAHAGPGENIWSNVHIDDLVTLYALAIEKAPAGSFYFAENGENSMREACEAINRMLGFAGPPTAMSMAEAAAEWGEGTTEDTMASNSRVRAKRARQLGWKPKARGADRRDRAGVLSGVGSRRRPCERRDPYAAADRFGHAARRLRSTTASCGYGSLRSQGRLGDRSTALTHPVPPRARARHQLVIALHHLHRRAQA